MASRLFYGMAKKGWLWRPLAHVSASTQTPVTASVLVIVIILGLALWFPLETLAKSTSFLVLTVFVLANASLLLIKRSQPQPAGILNNPAWVPLAGIVTCTGLLMFQVFTG
jgi:amino acid transporter